MPTGYTADIAKGISFEQYALSCARAFGALIEMRDDPANAPIPERVEPSDYHVTARAQAEARLVELESMTPAQAEAAADAAHAEAVESHRRYRREKDELRLKYEAMLEKVRAYEAPTPDHIEFRSFMETQILSSIEWDCRHYGDEPMAAPWREWHAAEVKRASDEIARHAKEYARDVTRALQRTAWVAALRKSLNA